MLQLDYGDHRPLYEQIKDKLKQLIISGVMRENDKIPSVRELAASLAINPNTIQRAYKDLENEGYIYSLPARGSFVRPRNTTRALPDTSPLEEILTNTVKELKFLGADKQSLIAIINNIYKEE